MPNTVKLTKHAVDRIAFTQQGQSFYWDAELTGFGLRVGRASKAYFAEWKVGGRAGRTVRKTIGKHGPFTPETARKKAMALLVDMQSGVDPFEEERRERVKQITLKEAFEEFVAARKALKPNTLRDYRYCFERYFQDWHKKALTSITREMVARRHSEIGDAAFPVLRPTNKKTQPSPARANLAMRYLRALFNFAIRRYEPHITENPVRHLSFARSWYRIERRQTYIKGHELRRWFKAVMSLKNDRQTQVREIARDYILLLLFTGLRRAEASRLTWDNVDLKERTLTVTDTKNHETHTLPLPDFIFGMLKQRKKASTGLYVFDGAGKAGHLVEPRKQVLRVCKESGIEFRLHDLRRTFATIADSLDIPAYALKRLLNHKMRNDVTAGYIVADIERLRKPMERIADFILKAGGMRKSADVVRLPKRVGERT